MKNIYNKNISIFGDEFGIPILLGIIPVQLIKCIIVAQIRPNSHKFVHELCKKNKIDFLVQPNYKSSQYKDFISKFISYSIDLLICNSYSMKIRGDVLKIVNYNAINIHHSLLPKNKGPNPLQWAIIKGEKKTGISMHYITEEIDSGDIIFQEEIEIGFKDTWVDLSNKIKAKNLKFLKKYIPVILNNNCRAFKQNKKIGSRNIRLNEDSPLIDFDKMSDIEIYNLIRAQIAPLKGAFINYKNKKIYFDKFIDYEQIKFLRKNYSN